MTDLKSLEGARFTASELGTDDGPSLQGLLEECADYHELVFGRPPGPAEAQSAFYAGPEDGRSPENKMLLGIRLKGSQRLDGVLDAFRDYPERGVWYIGVLLFSPAARSSGAGRDVVETLARAAQERGAGELQLNVVEQNEAAHRFWLRCGFSEVRRWRQWLGARESVLIRLRRPL
jgi:ribosomal protein S18 acetylase RimI-like enzyme